MKTLDICVDFDGTCVTHAFPEVGVDIGAAPVLRALTDAGHRLILFTMRADVHKNTGFSAEVPQIHNGNFLTDAINWFIDNKIPLWGVQRNPTQDQWTTSPKAYGQLYIDDAALGCPLNTDPFISNRPFVDWERVTNYLIEEGLINEI